MTKRKENPKTRLLDLTGKVFGKLTVLSREGTHINPSGNSKPIWKCICYCGNTVFVVGPSLRNGNTKSCGCIHLEHARNLNFKHGKTDTPTHQSWRGMLERCNNPSNSHYPVYGGKGIKVCERWKEFINFVADMGERPEGHTLDRIDNKGYELSNCKWSTSLEQSRNTSRTYLITWNGKTKCLTDWASELNITREALRYRLKNWSLEKAMAFKKLD